MTAMERFKVQLPGGYRDPGGRLFREAELSPLTGREEEMQAEKGGNKNASPVPLLLNRCVRRLGDMEPVPGTVVSALTAADRLFLLLKLREMTFGDLVRAAVTCPWQDCKKKVDINFSTRELPLEEAEESHLDLEADCPECGGEFTIPFDVPGFFFGELHTGLHLLYREVHFLAFHYHWSEEEILGMTRSKRQRYIEILAEEMERLNEKTARSGEGERGHAARPPAPLPDAVRATPLAAELPGGDLAGERQRGDPGPERNNNSGNRNNSSSSSSSNNNNNNNDSDGDNNNIHGNSRQAENVEDFALEAEKTPEAGVKEERLIDIPGFSEKRVFFPAISGTTPGPDPEPAEPAEQPAAEVSPAPASLACRPPTPAGQPAPPVSPAVFKKSSPGTGPAPGSGGTPRRPEAEAGIDGPLSNESPTQSCPKETAAAIPVSKRPGPDVFHPPSPAAGAGPANPVTLESAAQRLEHLRREVRRLNTQTAAPPDPGGSKEKEKPPPPRPPARGVRQAGRAFLKRPGTRAFWERSGLGRFHLKMLR